MLSRRQRQELSTAGWSKLEIGLLNADLSERPQIFSLEGPAWQEVLRQRTNMVRRERRKGKTDKQITRKINRRYSDDEEASIWDFIKAAYKPPDRITDYRMAQRQRAQDRLKGLYGRQQSARGRRT